MQLVERGDPRLDRTASSHPQRPDCLDRAGPGLRRPGGGAGLDRSGSRDRVNRIGFALTPARLPVGPVDLDHPHVLRGQVPGQTGTVGARPLNTDRTDISERPDPCQQRSITRRRRRELPITQQASDRVDHCAVVSPAVGIHAADDFLTLACHAGTAISFCLAPDGMARTSRSRWTRQ